ncbi:hypothetical protein EIP91_001676 [Steccherinum ochraceum]|uniref:Arrestin-like N-terminal domain-containing protein n=1 Tax=Steccherinum ochraceum TaxID=92696 RepID=A0A4R0RG09_9APHY|nr:hypothetical protein EIP91_001676 [Steccherinum ochraceum]
MSVSIEIVPFADSLDMYGEPDRSAAYSISGHVVISMSNKSFLFPRRRAFRLLLRSLVVTFEGQSELLAHETTYSAVRLCAISQELAPGEPIELNAEDNDDMDKPCTWNVVFNLTVPGWLPPSSIFGDIQTGGETGTRYALHASAKFESVDDCSASTWLSTLCNPFRFSPLRTVKAPKCPITLNRFMSTPYHASSSTSLFPLANYHVSAQPEARDEDDSSARIPPHILSGLRVVCSVPEHVGTDEDTVPFSLRLRTTGLPEEDCKRLRVTEFAVDLEQHERYCTQPSTSYCAQYPVPPRREQPPFKPLLSAHPVHSLYELGVAPYPPPRHVLARAFSIMPDDLSGRYTLAGNGYVFTQDAHAGDNVTWYSLSTNIPVSHEDIQVDKDWRARRRLRSSGQSPLFDVNHRLLVTVVCTYDLIDGNEPVRATERLNFCVPLRFVRVPPPSPSASRTSSPSPMGFCSPSSSGRTSPCELPLPSLPYAQSLPAYSQLFDSNGDRKIDYSVPLPLYTPREVDNKDEAPNEEENASTPS